MKRRFYTSIKKLNPVWWGFYHARIMGKRREYRENKNEIDPSNQRVDVLESDQGERRKR